MSERRERIRETGERRKIGSEKDLWVFLFCFRDEREREEKRRDSGFGVRGIIANGDPEVGRVSRGIVRGTPQ